MTELLVMYNNAVQIKMAEVDMRQMHNKCNKSACPSMMTSSNGNIFRFTGPLCGEFTGKFP